MHSVDREELSLIRTMIFDLQEEKDKLKQTDMHLSDELYKKQKHLDDLHNLIDELRDVKADKDLLSMGFELKADKREVDAKIGRQDFEHYMSLVDQSLRDLLQRLDGQVSCCLFYYSIVVINIGLVNLILASDVFLFFSTIRQRAGARSYGKEIPLTILISLDLPKWQ